MNAERALASLEKFGAALTGMAEGNFELKTNPPQPLHCAKLSSNPFQLSAFQHFSFFLQLSAFSFQRFSFFFLFLFV